RMPPMPRRVRKSSQDRPRSWYTKVGAGKKDDPAKVAEQGFEALMKGDDHVVAGSMMNKVQAVAGKVVPDTVKAEMHRKMAEPGSAD
ncbi:oxidoreductase, partial [Asanoa sp. NPDC050611]